MSPVPRPPLRPANPRFCSGPCTKRPGWTTQVLNDAAVGRYHRSGVGKAKLVEVIERSRRLLGLPDGHRLAIVPASDTGAVEMALWNLLGARGVDMLAWESFGKGWVTDVTKELRLEDVRVLDADYGRLPDLSRVDFGRDVVFTWNGTTSGVRVPDGDWIADDRQGLTICDATSAVFAMDLPWEKLDVATWSWQKVLGGEAQHGMLALGPRAIKRLQSHVPPWPLPKIFRLTKGGKLNGDLFAGATINTPSLLATEDHLDGLAWAESLGGLPALLARSRESLAAVEAWEAETPWAAFMAENPATRSSTSICLKIVDEDFRARDPAAQTDFAKRMVRLLEEENVAYDVAAYRDAPPGLRLWGGATVEPEDIRALLPWLDWAFHTVKADG